MRPVPNKAKDLAYYKALMDRYFGPNHALSKESALLRLKRSMSASSSGSGLNQSILAPGLYAQSPGSAGTAGSGGMGIGLLAARKQQQQQHIGALSDATRQASILGMTRPRPRTVLPTTTIMLDDGFMQDDVGMIGALGMASKRVMSTEPELQHGDGGPSQPPDVSTVS